MSITTTTQSLAWVVVALSACTTPHDVYVARQRVLQSTLDARGKKLMTLETVTPETDPLDVCAATYTSENKLAEAYGNGMYAMAWITGFVGVTTTTLSGISGTEKNSNGDVSALGGVTIGLGALSAVAATVTGLLQIKNQSHSRDAANAFSIVQGNNPYDPNILKYCGVRAKAKPAGQNPSDNNANH